PDPVGIPAPPAPPLPTVLPASPPAPLVVVTPLDPPGLPASIVAPPFPLPPTPPPPALVDPAAPPEPPVPAPPAPPLPTGPPQLWGPGGVIVVPSRHVAAPEPPPMNSTLIVAFVPFEETSVMVGLPAGSVNVCPTASATFIVPGCMLRTQLCRPSS